MTEPLVSVIIPAYRARATLARAIASVAASGLPRERIEVVIAPDDGEAYDNMPDHGMILTCCAPGIIRSGAGPTRNRALERAQAPYIAFLDADDTWAPGYLGALLPLALASGAAFGQTSVKMDGQEILRLPGPDRDSLDFSDFALTGGSFHPVVRRDIAGPFRDLPSQDVMHALEVISVIGGTAPLGPAVYELHLSRQSATASTDFTNRISRAYAKHASATHAGQTRILPRDISAVCAVFDAKTRLNEAFMKSGTSNFFYEFIRAHLS